MGSNSSNRSVLSRRVRAKIQSERAVTTVLVAKFAGRPSVRTDLIRRSNPIYRYVRSENIKLRYLWQIIRKRFWLVAGIAVIITAIVTTDFAQCRPARLLRIVHGWSAHSESSLTTSI